MKQLDPHQFTSFLLFQELLKWKPLDSQESVNTTILRALEVRIKKIQNAIFLACKNPFVNIPVVDTASVELTIQGSWTLYSYNMEIFSYILRL